MRTLSLKIAIALIASLACSMGLTDRGLQQNYKTFGSVSKGVRLFGLANVSADAFNQPEFTTVDGPTGLRLYLQAWNPLTPDQPNVLTLLDEPSMVSDSLQNAWTQLRDETCKQIKGKMGLGGAANGQTLSDIKCLLDDHMAFSIASSGQQMLRATFAVGGYIEATSTTPTKFGSYLDPRLSVSLDGKLELTIAIQPNRDQTLRVETARFTVNDARLDSHNAVGDLAKWVVDDLIPFFGGPNYKNMAESAVNDVSVDLAGIINSALESVNAKAKGPSDAVRIGVSGSSGYISVAFAPRDITPPTNGSISGLLRWNASEFTPRNGCQSFDVRATVQTGPVPMFVPDASAPTSQVGSFQISAVDDHTCSFTLSGIAAGWPNVITARILDGGATSSAGSSLTTLNYVLVGSGWNGRTVVPQPSADGRNYIVQRNFGATSIKDTDYRSKAAVVRTRTDPRVNPGDNQKRHADEVSLNPQPLPPRSDSAQAQKAEPSVGTESGIIIVGGNNGKRHPTTTRPVDGLDALATKGFSLANQDPVALELRNQQPDDAARRGFDIGMGVAEADTLPGPGKQRIHDSLPSVEQEGFSAAVSYSLARNRKQFTDLAPKGAELAARDPLAGELRDQIADGPARLGFDIGMAVAERDTLPGPGKQRIQDSLYPDERDGFALAVAFSLERNRNIELAKTGASIAQLDPYVATARNRTRDVFYRIGFDVATALFGSREQGAVGSTVMGPGAMKIRDALSSKAQAGFNDSVKFHLSRKY